MSRPLDPFPQSEPIALIGHPKSNARKRVILLVSITASILLGTLGVMIFWRLQHTAKHATYTPTQNQRTVPTTPTDAVSQQYISKGTDLNLNFTYPSTWMTNPVSGNNSNDQPITVVSPITSLSIAGDSTVRGKAVVTIRPGSASMSEFSSGNAIVSQNSSQFAYSKPTASQHQYPYLTFVHLVGGQNPMGVFDEVIITGVTPFTKGAALTTSSLGQLDPIISARFYTCNGTCDGTNASGLNVTSDAWQNTPIFQEVQSIFASLQLN